MSFYKFLFKKGDKNTLYSIATIFVNLANAFEVKKPSEELLELAKYAKYHIPEEHEKVVLIKLKLNLFDSEIEFLRTKKNV